MATWTIPRTWTAGETVTAANMNTHVRDNELAITGIWNSWTPNVVQGVSVTVTNTQSRYTRIGRTIIGYFNLAVTSTGTAATAVLIGSFPSPATSLFEIGTGNIRDSSAALNYPALLFLGSTTTIDLRASAATQDDNRLGITGSGFSAALATGDTLRGTFIYEASTD